jgi:hypothetical protein
MTHIPTIQPVPAKSAKPTNQNARRTVTPHCGECGKPCGVSFVGDDKPPISDCCESPDVTNGRGEALTGPELSECLEAWQGRGE